MTEMNPKTARKIDAKIPYTKENAVQKKNRMRPKKGPTKSRLYKNKTIAAPNMLVCNHNGAKTKIVDKTVIRINLAQRYICEKMEKFSMAGGGI